MTIRQDACVSEESISAGICSTAFDLDFLGIFEIIKSCADVHFKSIKRAMR